MLVDPGLIYCYLATYTIYENCNASDATSVVSIRFTLLTITNRL